MAERRMIVNGLIHETAIKRIELENLSLFGIDIHVLSIDMYFRIESFDILYFNCKIDHSYV